jgi:uncharacterized membrane protein
VESDFRKTRSLKTLSLVRRPETLFLVLLVPLQLLYLNIMNPLLDFPHAVERYMHVAAIAHQVTGGEAGTIPQGFVRYAIMAGKPTRVRNSIPEEIHRKMRQEADEEKKIREAQEETEGKVPSPSFAWLRTDIPLDRDVAIPFQSYSNPKAYSFIAYGPELVGCGIGILLGLSPATILLLALLSRIVVSVALGYWAIRISPILKWQMLALLLLPIMLMMECLIMPDVLLINFCLLFVAGVLRVRLNEKCTGGNTALFALLGALIGQFKNVYAGVTGIFLLVPLALFRSVRHKLVATFAVLALGLLSSVLWSAYTIQDNMDRDNEGWSTISMQQQMQHAKEQPLDFLAEVITLVTTADNYKQWEKKQLNRRLNGLLADTNGSIRILYVALFLSALAALPRDKKVTLKPWERIISGTIFLGMFFVIVVAMKMVTDPEAPPNIHLRYFLPILPLLWLAFYNVVPARGRVISAVPPLLIVFALYLNIFVLARLYGI